MLGRGAKASHLMLRAFPLVRRTAAALVPSPQPVDDGFDMLEKVEATLS